VYDASPRYFDASFPPTSTKVYVELMVGEIRRHTCIRYFAKSKTRPERVNKSYNLDQDVHVCGVWMVCRNGKMRTFSCMLSLLYFILDMANFSFLGPSCVHFFCIAHVFLAKTLGERGHTFCGIFISGGWMDGMFANFRCGNLVYG
jgi:hypothetical protein